MLPIMKRGLAEAKAGKSPGTVANYAEAQAHKTKIELMSYTGDTIAETCTQSATQLIKALDSDHKHWVCFYGLSEVEAIREIGDHFLITPLALEDILNTDHRPKVEINDNYVLVIIKMLNVDETGNLMAEQVSLVITQNVVITFQEKYGDLFDSIRARLRKTSGRIRTMPVDYLAMALVDIIIDHYFVVLESIAEALEGQEMMLLNKTGEINPKKIHELKMRLFYLRKIGWPLREVASALIRRESDLLRKESRFYFEDIYDHAVHVFETVETLREFSTSIKELYLADMDRKTNEIMKILTIMATIFIPLTFIAGIYGMNFEYMPELQWKYGYFAALGAMGVLSAVMLGFFRSKRWI